MAGNTSEPPFSLDTLEERRRIKMSCAANNGACEYLLPQVIDTLILASYFVENTVSAQDNGNNIT